MDQVVSKSGKLDALSKKIQFQIYTWKVKV